MDSVQETPPNPSVNQELVNSLAYDSKPVGVRKYDPELVEKDRQLRKRQREDEYVRKIDPQQRPILVVREERRFESTPNKKELGRKEAEQNFMKLTHKTESIEDLHEAIKASQALAKKLEEKPQSDLPKGDGFYKIEGIEFLPEGFLELDPLILRDEYDFDSEANQKHFLEEQRRVKAIRRAQYDRRLRPKQREVTILVKDEAPSPVREFLEGWYFKNKRPMNPQEVEFVSKLLDLTPEKMETLQIEFLQAKKVSNQALLNAFISKGVPQEQIKKLAPTLQNRLTKEVKPRVFEKPDEYRPKFINRHKKTKKARKQAEKNRNRGDVETVQGTARSKDNFETEKPRADWKGVLEKLESAVRNAESVKTYGGDDADLSHAGLVKRSFLGQDGHDSLGLGHYANEEQYDQLQNYFSEQLRSVFDRLAATEPLEEEFTGSSPKNSRENAAFPFGSGTSPQEAIVEDYTKRALDSLFDGLAPINPTPIKAVPASAQRPPVDASVENLLNDLGGRGEKAPATSGVDRISELVARSRQAGGPGAQGFSFERLPAVSTSTKAVARGQDDPRKVTLTARGGGNTSFWSQKLTPCLVGNHYYCATVEEEGGVGEKKARLVVREDSGEIVGIAELPEGKGGIYEVSSENRGSRGEEGRLWVRNERGNTVASISLVPRSDDFVASYDKAEIRKDPRGKPALKASRTQKAIQETRYLLRPVLAGSEYYTQVLTQHKKADGRISADITTLDEEGEIIHVQDVEESNLGVDYATLVDPPRVDSTGRRFFSLRTINESDNTISQVEVEPLVKLLNKYEQVVEEIVDESGNKKITVFNRGPRGPIISSEQLKSSAEISPERNNLPWGANSHSTNEKTKPKSSSPSTPSVNQTPIVSPIYPPPLPPTRPVMNSVNRVETPSRAQAITIPEIYGKDTGERIVFDSVKPAPSEAVHRPEMSINLQGTSESPSAVYRGGRRTPEKATLSPRPKNYSSAVVRVPASPKAARPKVNSVQRLLESLNDASHNNSARKEPAAAPLNAAQNEEPRSRSRSSQQNNKIPRSSSPSPDSSAFHPKKNSKPEYPVSTAVQNKYSRGTPVDWQGQEDIKNDQPPQPIIPTSEVNIFETSLPENKRETLRDLKSPSNPTPVNLEQPPSEKTSKLSYQIPRFTNFSQEPVSPNSSSRKESIPKQQPKLSSSDDKVSSVKRGVPASKSSVSPRSQTNSNAQNLVSEVKEDSNKQPSERDSKSYWGNRGSKKSREKKSSSVASRKSQLDSLIERMSPEQRSPRQSLNPSSLNEPKQSTPAPIENYEIQTLPKKESLKPLENVQPSDDFNTVPRESSDLAAFVARSCKEFEEDFNDLKSKPHQKPKRRPEYQQVVHSIEALNDECLDSPSPTKKEMREEFAEPESRTSKPQTSKKEQKGSYLDRNTDLARLQAKEKSPKRTVRSKTDISEYKSKFDSEKPKQDKTKPEWNDNYDSKNRQPRPKKEKYESSLLKKSKEPKTEKRTQIDESKDIQPSEDIEPRMSDVKEIRNSGLTEKRKSEAKEIRKSEPKELPNSDQEEKEELALNEPVDHHGSEEIESEKSQKELNNENEILKKQILETLEKARDSMPKEAQKTLEELVQNSPEEDSQALMEEFFEFCQNELPSDHDYQKSMMFVSLFYYFLEKRNLIK